MTINFIIRGRLGNAIFRYMASVIICLHFNVTYSINKIQIDNLSDEEFLKICNSIIGNHILNNEIISKIKYGINMNCFYQHDLIYKLHKNKIISFINMNPSQYILTDGIQAGDDCCEKFYMQDILNTSLNFNKIYKNVLHIRLEDFVTHNLYIDKYRIINLLEICIISELCIVCKKPSTDFEFDYINFITEYLERKNIIYVLEYNDVLTDYYIMKECEVLICSKSTLSWCAAFFSNKIKKCYFPDYEITSNSTCKMPIDNTETY